MLKNLESLQSLKHLVPKNYILQTFFWHTRHIYIAITIELELDNTYISINAYIAYLRFMYHPDVLYFIQHNI